MKFYNYSNNQAKKIIQEVGVPEELHEEALESIKAGWKRANSFKSLFSNLTAPIVVPFALLFCKWESESLPKFFSWYDNDTNLNGDEGIPVSLDPKDSVAIENCYYRKGHHPREYLSRYVWIGLRNRGKNSYMQEGYPLEEVTQEWGTVGLTSGSESEPAVTGWNVSRSILI